MTNPSKILFKPGKRIKLEFIPRSAHCKHDCIMSIERRIFLELNLALSKVTIRL